MRWFLIILKYLIVKAASNNEFFILTKNTDLLNKSASNKWMIESSIAKSKITCLTRCKQLLYCASAFLYQNHDCFLYSKSFTSNELSVSSFSNMYTTSIGCPSGWLYFNKNCYKLFQSVMMFWSAQAYCLQQLKTSYLADIVSQDEFNWVSNHVTKSSNYSVWVCIEISISSN